MSVAANPLRPCPFSLMEVAAAQRLSPLVQTEWRTRVASRSPVGPGALKVEVGGDSRAVGEALRAEPWVEAVSVRPRHLYVKIATSALRSWIAAGCLSWLADAPDPPEVRRRSDFPADGGLTEFRRSAVGSSLSAIADADIDGSLAVGRIDVRNGPLRMRNGGEVHRQDAEREILRRWGEDPPPLPDAAALALTIAVLATPRDRHIHLDDAWIGRSAETLRSLAEAMSESQPPPSRVPASARTEEERVRALAQELDAFPRHVGLAASELDPAHLARSATAVARHGEGLSLDAGDPILLACRAGLRFGLALLSPGADLASPTPRRPRRPPARLRSRSRAAARPRYGP